MRLICMVISAVKWDLMMVCDWWECSKRSECEQRYKNRNYPPCAVCVSFDKCDVCVNAAECTGLIFRYLPHMYRRLVREIRLGEDTTKTQQIIRQHTPKSGKRGD